MYCEMEKFFICDITLAESNREVTIIFSFLPLFSMLMEVLTYLCEFLHTEYNYIHSLFVRLQRLHATLNKKWIINEMIRVLKEQ